MNEVEGWVHGKMALFHKKGEERGKGQRGKGRGKRVRKECGEGEKEWVNYRFVWKSCSVCVGLKEKQK